MPVTFGRTIATIAGHASIEEVEALEHWLDQGPRRSVDLNEARHIHTAVLQLLLARKTKIKAWPAEPTLRAVLMSILAQKPPELLPPMGNL